MKNMSLSGFQSTCRRFGKGMMPAPLKSHRLQLYGRGCRSAAHLYEQTSVGRYSLTGAVWSANQRNGQRPHARTRVQEHPRTHHHTFKHPSSRPLIKIVLNIDLYPRMQRTQSHGIPRTRIRRGGGGREGGRERV